MKYLKNKYTLYLIFGFSITVIFLYLKFPSESVSRYAEIKLSRLEKIDVTVGSSKPLFPPGVSLRKLCINYKSKRAGCIEKINVYPSFLSFFKSYTAKGDLFGGVFDIDSGNSYVKGFFKNIKINRINIGSFMTVPYNAQLAGSLNIDFDLKNIQKRKEGFINISASDFTADLKGLPFKKVDFKTIKLNLSVKDKKADVESLIFTGKDFSGSAKGVVYLNSNPAGSRINIKCTIKPEKSAVKKYEKMIPVKYLMKKGKIDFVIKGTLQKPLWRLN